MHQRQPRPWTLDELSVSQFPGNCLDDIHLEGFEFLRVTWGIFKPQL